MVLAPAGPYHGLANHPGAVPRSWPDALADCLRDDGGDILLNRRVDSADDLPTSPLLCLQHHTPPASGNFRVWVCRKATAHDLSRFRYGPGVYKMDWALRSPIPWKAEICRKAGVVHLGGSFEEIATSLRNVSCRHPAVITLISSLAQPSLFDTSRAPAGFHTAWAYCHVPHGSNADVSALIEEQDRTLRAGISRRHFSQTHFLRSGHGTAQCQLRRRGHQRRHSRISANFIPGPSLRSILTGHRRKTFIFVLPPRPRAEAFTVCAATTRFKTFAAGCKEMPDALWPLLPV
ncbi:MAG: hypothetical protein MZV70_24990 [Desulfobacterales bacterium]|nr:hypothetical protein [Desulfobacterales bacterium]